MQDLALAIALAVYNVASLIPETRQLQLPYVAFLLVVLQAVPLTWRRRWPVAVFVAVGIPRAIYDQLGINFAPIPLGPAIAYYTVMDRCSTRVRVVISALLVVGVIRSQTLPGHTEPYDFFVAALQFAVAGTLGILSRTRRAYLQAVETRAEQAEAERDRQVALAAARGADQDRQGTARRGGASRQPHGGPVGGRGRTAARPARRGRQGRGDHRPDGPGGADRARRLLGVLRGPADVNGRAATSPSRRSASSTR